MRSLLGVRCRPAYVGGDDVELDVVQRAARLCAANLRVACRGDLGRMQISLMLCDYVNATDAFEDTPLVTNSASHSVGVRRRRAPCANFDRGASLPERVCVEIDELVAIDTVG